MASTGTPPNKYSGVYLGSSLSGKNFFAPALVYWEAIKFAKSKGAKEYILGGVPVEARTITNPQYGVYEFKKGFGGVEQDRFGGSKIINKIKYRLYDWWFRLRHKK